MVDFLWLPECTLKMILHYSFHLIWNEPLESSLKFTPVLCDLSTWIPSIMSLRRSIPFPWRGAPLASSARPPISFAGVPSLAPGSSAYQLPCPLRVMASLWDPNFHIGKLSLLFFFFFLYFGEDSVCHSNTLARAGSQQVRGASALPLFFLKTSSVLSPWLLRSPVTTNLLLFSAPSDMRLTLSLLCFLLPFTAVTRHHRNLPSGSWPHSVWRRSHHTVAFASLSSSTLSFWSLSQGGPDFPRLLDYLVCLLLWLRVPLAGHTVVFPKGLLLPSPPVPSLHDVPYSWGSRSPPMQMSWNGWF